MTTALPNDVTIDIRAGGDDRCAACPHPSSTHDPLSARFCAATVSSALDRACICR
ncbi:RGCVC family protein [Actinosynnema sp. NPDC047251]|uniref:RGCVC family protein n=1 Tax=Saccharothrix espanaensis TaxID=103731 RepID=UPI000A2F83F2|nr:RGCVC family protein [Saccharothrix espanaensis]